MRITWRINYVASITFYAFVKMTHSPKIQDVKQAEHVRLSKMIGARLRALREKKDITPDQLASALGQTPRAVLAAETGNNLNAYIKLAELARLLGTTPNEILGFQAPQADPSERDVFRGILEAGLMQRGMPFVEAEPLATSILEVLDNPVVRSEGTSPRENARILALALMQRFFER